MDAEQFYENFKYILKNNLDCEWSGKHHVRVSGKLTFTLEDGDGRKVRVDWNLTEIKDV